MSTGKDSSAASSKSGGGLRGVVAAKSTMSKVNGEEGILIYQGFNIHDLAENATFEETDRTNPHRIAPKRYDIPLRLIAAVV